MHFKGFKSFSLQEATSGESSYSYFLSVWMVSWAWIRSSKFPLDPGKVVFRIISILMNSMISRNTTATIMNIFLFLFTIDIKVRPLLIRYVLTKVRINLLNYFWEFSVLRKPL